MCSRVHHRNSSPPPIPDPVPNHRSGSSLRPRVPHQSRRRQGSEGAVLSRRLWALLRPHRMPRYPYPLNSLSLEPRPVMRIDSTIRLQRGGASDLRGARGARRRQGCAAASCLHWKEQDPPTVRTQGRAHVATFRHLQGRGRWEARGRWGQRWWQDRIPAGTPWKKRGLEEDTGAHINPSLGESNNPPLAGTHWVELYLQTMISSDQALLTLSCPSSNEAWIIIGTEYMIK